MLPGFRLIIMTLVLGTSILIFGLGAAALLRASHEEFASLPALRTMEKPLPPTLAERFDTAAPPTLALLRIEPQTAAPPEPIATPATTETPDLNARSEPPQVQPAPAAKHSVKRKGRKRVVRSRRPRVHANLSRTRLVQRIAPADPFPFFLSN